MVKFTDRKVLFNAQMAVSLLSIILMVFVIRPPMENILKTAIAPFASVSLILFLLFLVDKVYENFHEGEQYSKKNILISIAVVLLGVAMMFAIIAFLKSNNTLDKVLFYVSIFISIIILLYNRVRNLWSMSVITGISEGVIVYVVFFL